MEWVSLLPTSGSRTPPLADGVRPGLGLGDLVHGTFSFERFWNGMGKRKRKERPVGALSGVLRWSWTDQPPDAPRGRRARPATARVRVKNVRSGIEVMAVDVGDLRAF